MGPVPSHAAAPAVDAAGQGGGSARAHSSHNPHERGGRGVGPSLEARRRWLGSAAEALSAEADSFLQAEDEEAEAELAVEAELAQAAAAAPCRNPGKEKEPPSAARTSSSRRGGLCALRRYLAHRAACEDERSATEGPADVLPVLTIHASKGLEFAHVVVARVNEDCLPLACSRSDNHEAELEEERRIGYVAVTRACRSLALTFVTRIEGANMHRSRFLDGILKLGAHVVRRSEAYELRQSDAWPRLPRPPPRKAASRAPPRTVHQAGA
ncbi:P-loop containing nucleoside triphosphate hydrolase protein [Pavlovales sp. CCMP2436]|nr:P-loop containing nucleoside triphosphate hydrolase protein [Pavlovales sp. CCMP2436]|mmetsp:Transcript_24415/g.56524  ORF Transcript_24415/g.56524 Transcript_24415/m.56524 type:complete len:269 (-) Transcript_24415:218-1024(-)